MVADAVRLVFLSSAPLSIDTESLPPAMLGEPYEVDIEVSGGTAPIVLEVAGGSLPAGLALDPQVMQIAGTPTEAGSFGLDLVATDVDESAKRIAVFRLGRQEPARRPRPVHAGSGTRRHRTAEQPELQARRTLTVTRQASFWSARRGRAPPSPPRSPDRAPRPG